ncbi:putative YqaJ viral recombinase [Emiliania huxleyi CCMP1516]|uniref:YqaJ viral recombinase domain-containing protein n=2 Tax=Emiliania huxleyi TaxID=2903 RepID=A0A0D3J854_EMIH1|nr:putative YqaJ viral recombinase [Emiliania huxleyi CCMP1516]EOD19689.1 putative YqaJ viral recombinase [Emiliania huxleyi CCMP1516]|eukprot:XP_005772118.1 putative YqaJ viral recombinase [Emiliania huxleyi CCMP1516]
MPLFLYFDGGRALARANNSLPPQASERLVLIPADRTNAGLSRPVYSLVVAGHNNTEAARRATRRRACLDGRPAGAGSRPWQAERARGGRPRVRSVELTRRNHATVLFSDGSHREVHTPSLDQRTDEAEWLAVRAALEITASEFAAAKDEWRHASRDLLLRRKLGDPAAQFRGNAATAFGTQMEPRAVRMYERVTGHAVEPTGLHMHDNLRWGASPDGIVTTAANETGLLEVKCSFRHRRRGAVPQLQDCPAEFFAQIQGQLAVTGHDWRRPLLLHPAWPALAGTENWFLEHVTRLGAEFWTGEYCPEQAIAAAGGGRHWSLVRVPRDDDYFAALAPSLEFGSVLREEEILRR